MENEKTEQTESTDKSVQEADSESNRDDDSSIESAGEEPESRQSSDGDTAGEDGRAESGKDEQPSDEDGKQDRPPTEVIGEWLETVFEKMNYRAQTEAILEQQRLTVNVEQLELTDDEGVNRNTDLDSDAIKSLQTLLSASFSGVYEDLEFFVDIDNRRQQREAKMEGLAQSLVRAVRRLQRGITVAGLVSHERGEVHNMLEDEPDVETESVGDGAFRKLRVIPSSE